MADESFQTNRLLEHDEQQAVEEYKEFIERFVTDPTSLSVGSSYYVISVLARPIAKRLQVEKSNNLIRFDGMALDNFVFKSENSEFQLPLHQFEDDVYNPFFMTTTVYTSADECNHFLTMLSLKFAGIWRITQKEMPV